MNTTALKVDIVEVNMDEINKVPCDSGGDGGGAADLGGDDRSGDTDFGGGNRGSDGEGGDGDHDSYHIGGGGRSYSN